MMRRLSSVVVILLFATSACDRAAQRMPSMPSAERQDAAFQAQLEGERAKAPESIAAPAPSAASGDKQAAQPVAVPVQRKIIRNGDINLEVGSVEKAAAEVKSYVVSIGGYTAGESQSQGEYSVKQASITCRIPAEKLEAALEKLKRLGKPENLSINANDITEQYFNLEIRINNQKRLEGELLELLNRPTNKLADLLEVEREVARVRGEIDEMEGRKRFWDNQVDFSTIVVNMHEPRPAIAGGEGGALRKLLRSFRQAGENFVDAVAGIIAVSGALIPIIVVLGVIVWIVRKLWGRRKRAP